MADQLLAGATSTLRHRRPGYKRRSDAISYGSDYQKAAALVDLAEDGVGLPEQILDLSTFHSAAKYYFLYMRFGFLWALLYFALLILNFLERPLWCATNTDYTCSDRDYYYLGQLPYLTAAESLIYEGITLIVLLVHTFFPITYVGFNLYWKNHLTIFKMYTPYYLCFFMTIDTFNSICGGENEQLVIICLLILVADFLVYALYLSPVAFDSLPLRIAPYIRVIFFILSFRELRSCMLILAGMFGTFLNVMALGLLFLLFASWIAYVMFEDTEQGITIFTSYGTTLYQMFVLFTTSNNPDVWIPAYKASRWYCLFFVLYVLLGVYFVTNLILAVVYDSFKLQLVKQVSEADQTRKTILEKAFHLIEKDNSGYINKDQCIRLFEELNKYRTLPDISREEFELIFDELDDSGDFKINVQEFTDLCNAIALRFQKEDTPSLFEKFPTFYHSPISEKLKAFVRSPKFGYIISTILIINLFAVVVETTLDIAENSAQKVWQSMEFVLGWVYVLEMVLKVYSFGFENYWRDGQNRFDFVVTLIIVIGETLTFAAPAGLTFLSNGEWIRYLLIARMLRLIRLLMHVKRCRAFIATFLTLLPSLMPYLGTIFCVMCMYCALGVQIFGGIVNAGNANLEATDLYDNDYLLFNFNDYPNGMVTLFNILVLGNWQAWMQSYKALTGTSWTYVYFISFYLITVLLLLNLVVAFVLEAFFAEMELESEEICEEHEGEAEGVKDRRRSVGSKSRSQRVDALLHHMLSSELNETQSSRA